MGYALIRNFKRYMDVEGEVLPRCQFEELESPFEHLNIVEPCDGVAAYELMRTPYCKVHKLSIEQYRAQLRTTKNYGKELLEKDEKLLEAQWSQSTRCSFCLKPASAKLGDKYFCGGHAPESLKPAGNLWQKVDLVTDMLELCRGVPLNDARLAEWLFEEAEMLEYVLLEAERDVLLHGQPTAMLGRERIRRVGQGEVSPRDYIFRVAGVSSVARTPLWVAARRTAVYYMQIAEREEIDQEILGKPINNLLPYEPKNQPGWHANNRMVESFRKLRIRQ